MSLIFFKSKRKFIQGVVGEGTKTNNRDPLCKSESLPPFLRLWYFFYEYSKNRSESLLELIKRKEGLFLLLYFLLILYFT